MELPIAIFMAAHTLAETGQTARLDHILASEVVDVFVAAGCLLRRHRGCQVQGARGSGTPRKHGRSFVVAWASATHDAVPTTRTKVDAREKRREPEKARFFCISAGRRRGRSSGIKSSTLRSQ